MPQNILGEFNVKGLSFYLGSDFHWGINGEYGLDPNRAVSDLARRLKNEARMKKVLILGGDLFHGSTPDGKVPPYLARSQKLFFWTICASFPTILYVPGNHGLRWDNDPWGKLDLPPNVITPLRDQPVKVEINGVKILLGNLFYDLDFIPQHDELGFSREEILRFYREETNDGRHLLDGPDSFPLFKQMTANLAKEITPDIDIVVVHSLPHPSLVTFRVPNITPGTEALSTKLGLTFSHRPERDQMMAEKYGTTPDDYRRWRNCKCMLMGSNLFDPELGAQPRDGLTVIHGHNHHPGDRVTKIINGKEIHFLTHQRMQSNFFTDKE